MKADRSGGPGATARIPPSATDAARGRKPPLRAVIIACALVALAALLAFELRHAIVGWLITRGAGALTGDRVSLGAFHVGANQSVFNGVRVETRDGDPLFEARRVSLRYSLGGLLGPGKRRWGISDVTLDGPVISIVRHGDGSYNIAAGAANAGGSAGPASATGAPWNLRLSVHDGEVRLIDRAPVAGDLGIQRIVALNLELRARSADRSTSTGSAQFESRQTQNSALQRWPLRLEGIVDLPRGAAVARIDAPRLPIRGPIGFVQHSAAVRVDDGVLGGVAVRIYALDIGLNRPPEVHVGAVADLTAGRLEIAALRRPARDLRGRIRLVDDGVWTTRLDGSLAGIPVVARGGAYDRHAPRLRLGLRGDGDLHDLRALFGFSKNQPVSGRAQIETVIEAPVSGVLIRSALRVPRGAYGAEPLTGVSGRVDYHAGVVVLDGVRGSYGATAVGVGARFVLGGPALDSAIVAAASAPGRAIPFAENLAPEASVSALALITGGTSGYRARGALGVQGRGVAGRGIFAVDELGVGEFGPFSIARSDGSSVLGALRLERPVSQSAAWISARRFRVAVPGAASSFPGLRLPAFPPVAGVIDGELAGGGAPGAFAVAGSLTGHDLRVGNARLGSGSVTLGGSLTDLRLGRLAIAGPLGRFSGAAAVAGGAFALRGAYDGSLERLVPLTGNQSAHGAVRGTVLATLADAGVVVQSPAAALRGGSLRGVALDAAGGTIAERRDGFHLVAGSAAIAGRRAVAAESGGKIAVSAPDIPSAALRGTGLPLDAGNVSAYGLADLRGRLPSFMGTVMVAGGQARGYRVAGDARIDLLGSKTHIMAATGALGSTYGAIAGSIAGLGAGELHYDLDASVPLGDIDSLRRDLGLPVRFLAGSFDARLHVHGSGTRPFVDGRVSAPEGAYNGLAFRAAGARVQIGGGGIAARDGTLTVGSTQATLDASMGGGAFTFTARSPAADLADFNDYFDAGDTLAGRGGFTISLQTDGQQVRSQGAFALNGLRYRDFPLGTTSAHWRMLGAAIAGGASVHSAAGTLDLSGSITPARGSDPVRALRAAAYAGRANFGRVDLGTWLPALGSSAPILGRVDARVDVAGRPPQLSVSADAALTDATIGGLAVGSAHVRAVSRGSRVRVESSDANLGFAQFNGSGTLGWGVRDPLDFDLRLSTENIAQAARTLVPAARGRDLSGALDADIRVGGTRAAPKLQGGFVLRAARYGNFVVPQTIGSLALAGTAIELRDVDVEFTRGQAFVAGSLPLVLAPFGLGPARAPLSFDVTVRSVDLAQFAPLLPAGTKLGGTVDGRFGVEGTVDRPRLLGALSIAAGSYDSPFERAPIERVGASLDFAGSSIALQAFHAEVGGGALDGSGRITLPLGAGSRPAYEAALAARGAKLDFPAYGRGTIDGNLELTGGDRQPLISGTMALRHAVIPVSAVYGSASAAEAAGTGNSWFDPAFRLKATAQDDVRVRNSIVDIGVKGDLDISGTLRAPRLAGGFTATDGTISSYNHVFRIVNAAVSFDPADGVIPTIQARALSRVTNPDPDPSRNVAGSANIIVNVSGTPDSNNLQVTYSSDPPYSQEQIVGLLLDVPALLGAVNFNLNGGAGSPVLRGAPGETNALLPPGVTPEQVSAISFNQEVFSLLNGQFTQRALTPVERAFERVLGLSDIEFTVDYGGGIGYSLRRQLGKRDFYAFLSQTVTYPERSNIGFELEPKPFETINFSFYQQNGVTSLITNQTPGQELFSSTRRLTSVQPLGNRSGVSLNFNRRL